VNQGQVVLGDLSHKREGVFEELEHLSLYLQ
jgi:hypothetical protein